jgi:hypothetical protein
MENIDQRIDKIQEALKEQVYLNNKIVTLLEKKVGAENNKELLGLIKNIANRLSALEIAFSFLEQRVDAQVPRSD